MSRLALGGGVLILEPGGPSPHLLRTQLQLHLCVLLRLACFMVMKVYGLLLHVWLLLFVWRLLIVVGGLVSTVCL